MKWRVGRTIYRARDEPSHTMVDWIDVERAGVGMKIPLAALLAAFAAGATLLQSCARLPPAPGALAMSSLVLAAAAVFVVVRAPRHAMIAAASLVAVAAVVGYCHAAWRADVRLGDALPNAWEDVDLRVTGIVDDLPQNDASGARFSLAVEKAHTVGAQVPRRVSLAWHAPRATDDAAPPPSPPQVHAGERWTLTLR